MDTAIRAGVLLGGSTLSAGNLRSVLLDRLTRSLGKDPQTATPRDIYDALSLAVREELSARWLATQRRVAQSRVKRVCYLSVEFLPGRSLVNALSSLDGELVAGGPRRARRARATTSTTCRTGDRSRSRQRRTRPARGLLPGFARDAAVSGGRLRHPLRLRHLHAGHRRGRRGSARSASTLAAADAIPGKSRATTRVTSSASAAAAMARRTRGRHAAYRWVETQRHLAVGFDQLVPGQSQPDRQSPATVVRPRASRRSTSRCSMPGNYPRRWTTRSRRRICRACCTRTTPRRRARSCASSSSTSSSAPACRTCWRTHLAEGRALDDLPQALAIQLNDTHPTLAIPELIRLLVDEHEMEWSRPGALPGKYSATPTTRCCPRRSRPGRSHCFERLLPRHLQIIYLINREFLERGQRGIPGRAATAAGACRSSTRITAGRCACRTWRWSAATRSTASPSCTPSSCTKTIFTDFAQLSPDRFTNVTNGIAVRRWLKQSNPGLSALLTEHLGHALGERSRRTRPPARGRRTTRRSASASARSSWRNKEHLASVIHHRCGVNVDPHSLFDVQVKRIHEYKRQLLNLLYVITRYNRLRRGETEPGAAHGDLCRQGGARLRHGQGHHQAHQQRRAGRQRGSGHAGTGCAWCSCRTTMFRSRRRSCRRRTCRSRSRPRAWRPRAPAT